MRRTAPMTAFLGLLVALTGTASAQIATGDFAIGDPLFSGPTGIGVATDVAAQTITRVADNRTFNLPLAVQFDSDYNLDFRLSPSQQFLYVRKSNPQFGQTNVCGGFPNVQILMYELGATANPIPFTGVTGPACLEGPLSIQPRFWDGPGPIRTMFVVGASDSGSGAKHAVLWADLVARETAISFDDYQNGMNDIRFSPSGNAALLVHGLSSGPTRYSFIDLCVTPLGGTPSPQTPPPGALNGRVVMNGPDFQAVLLANGVEQPNTAVTLSTACWGTGIACCLPFGNCDDTIDGTQCQAMGGTASSGDCASATCVEACCEPDGSCRLETFAACGDPVGQMSCDGAFCPLPTEACCSLGGTCVDWTVDDCTQSGYTPQGPGTDCATFGTCPTLQVAVTKMAPATVAPGETFDYLIDYDNVGDLASTDSVLIDELPNGLAFVSATHGGSVVSFGRVEWNLGTVPTTGPSATGQVALTVRAECYANPTTFNQARFSARAGAATFYSGAVQTQVLADPLTPLAIAVSSSGSGGLPVEGGDLITHTIDLTNTENQARRGVSLSLRTTPGGSFESVLDPGSGTVDMFNATSWTWTGDLAPLSSTQIVVTVRVDACVDADTLTLEPLDAYTYCGDAIGSATAPVLPVRRAVEIDAVATSLAPPTGLETALNRAEYQVLRRGDTVDFRLTVTNPQPFALSASAGLTLPFGFDPATDPPFLPPVDPGATWNASSRRIDWTGTIPAGQSVTIDFRAHETAGNLASSLNASASDGTCTLWSSEGLAIFPPVPTDPYLTGAYETLIWTLRPGIDTTPQDVFAFGQEYIGFAGVAANGDVWVGPLPMFRANLRTLELEGYPFSFRQRLGFLPNDAAADPSDGTVLFAGTLDASFGDRAVIRRYDRTTDTITTVMEQPFQSPAISYISELLVTDDGTVGFTAGQRLYRVDAGGMPIDISDSGMTGYGTPAGLDGDKLLVTTTRTASPVPLFDVDPATGMHTEIAADLTALFPTVTFGFEKLTGGANGDVYVGYRFAGLGVVHPGSPPTATDLIPFDFFGREVLAMGFSDPADCTDADGDGAGVGSACTGPADCDDGDADVAPGAQEINDGKDNQCPGDAGAGAVDEVGGQTLLNGDELCWDAQPGATQYEVVRSADPSFATACARTVVAGPCWTDTDTPPSGVTWNYLVRALSPQTGSFGLDSTGSERSVTCP